MEARRHKPRDVRHIHHQVRAHLVRDLPKPFEVDDPRISACARADELRLVFLRQRLDLVVIDLLGFLVDPVVDHVEEPAGEIDLVTVCQVSAARQAHRENGIARLEDREVHRHVRAASAVRLNVHVLRAEELLRTVNGKPLRHVHELAAVVPALAGITLGVLVGHHRPLRLAHGLADVIFGSDQLDVLALTPGLGLDRGVQLRIAAAQGHRLGIARLARAHLVHAPLVPAARLEAGSQPRVENRAGLLHGNHGASERKDVRVVVYASHLGHVPVGAQRRAHAGKFIGRHAHPDARVADHDALLHRALGNLARHIAGIVRIVDRVLAEAADVLHVDLLRRKKLLHGFLEFVTRVIRANGNFHFAQPSFWRRLFKHSLFNHVQHHVRNGRCNLVPHPPVKTHGHADRVGNIRHPSRRAERFQHEDTPLRAGERRKHILHMLFGHHHDHRGGIRQLACQHPAAVPADVDLPLGQNLCRALARRHALRSHHPGRLNRHRGIFAQPVAQNVLRHRTAAHVARADEENMFGFRLHSKRIRVIVRSFSSSLSSSSSKNQSRTRPTTRTITMSIRPLLPPAGSRPAGSRLPAKHLRCRRPP